MRGIMREIMRDIMRDIMRGIMREVSRTMLCATSCTSSCMMLRTMRRKTNSLGVTSHGYAIGMSANMALPSHSCSLAKQISSLFTCFYRRALREIMRDIMRDVTPEVCPPCRACAQCFEKTKR